MSSSFLSRRKTPKSDGPRIDLGLSSLVASLNKSESTKSELNSESKLELKLEETLLEKELSDSSSKKLTEDIYSTLANQKKWGELSNLCENNMGTEDDGDPIVAVWWVRSKIELGTVPASILAAPLKRAAEKIIKFSEISSSSLIKPEFNEAVVRNELGRLLFEFSRKLIIGLSDSYSLIFAEFAVKMDPTSKGKVLELLNNEVKKLTLKTGRRAQREKRIDEINKLISSINSKSFIKAEHSKLIANEEFKPAISKSIQNSNTGTLPLPEAKKGINKSSNLGFFYSALFLIIVFSYFYGSYFQSLWKSRDVLAVQPIIDDRIIPASEVQEPQRLSNISSIDSILYGIGADRKTEIPTEIPSSAKISTQIDTNIKVEKILEPEKVLENNVDEKKKTLTKEKIDTQGPLEGSIFYPELRQEYTKDKEEVSLFPDSQDELKNPKPSNREVLDRARMFRIISKTKVMSSPSYFAVAMAILDPGARIEVIEKMGDWLKLRSRMGQSGYVLAQDAEPLN